jgi:hypothetical protein
MSRFEDDLWEMLSREHGAATLRAGRPSSLVPRRRRVLSLVAGAVTFAVVTGTAVVVLSARSGLPPAYAVTQNANGTVTLTLDDVIGVQPANDELARLGVRVVVAKVEAGCNETGDVVRSVGGSVFGMVESARVGDGLGGLRWVIHPAAIPQGDTLRLSVQIDPHSRIPAVGEGLGLFRGEAPKCSKPIIAR